MIEQVNGFITPMKGCNVIKIRVIRGLDTQKRLQILKLALS